MVYRDYHCSSFIVHRSSFIVHRSSFIVHRSSFIVHRSSFIVHRSSNHNACGSGAETAQRFGRPAPEGRTARTCYVRLKPPSFQPPPTIGNATELAQSIARLSGMIARGLAPGEPGTDYQSCPTPRVENAATKGLIWPSYF